MDSEHPARCENCKHFRYDETDMSTIKQGRCHRYPPAKDMNDLPRVKPGSVCGEWTPKNISAGYPDRIELSGGAMLTIKGQEIEAEDGSGAKLEISPDENGRIGRALTNIPPGSTFVLDLNEAVKPANVASSGKRIIGIRPVEEGFDPYAPFDIDTEFEDARGIRYELVGFETWKEHRSPKPKYEPEEKPKGSKPTITIGEGLSGSCDCPACRQLRTVAKAQISESIADSICVVKCDCGRCRIARILGAHDAMFRMIADRASEEQSKRPIEIDRIEDGKAYIGERMIGEVVGSDMMGRAGYKTCKVNTKGATEI